jgi:hypothetical protein
MKRATKPEMSQQRDVDTSTLSGTMPPLTHNILFLLAHYAQETEEQCHECRVNTQNKPDNG